MRPTAPGPAVDRLEWRGARQEGQEQGRRPRRPRPRKTTVRRPGTSPAHKLEEYAGEYEHPGYGIIKIELRDGKLNLAYNSIEAPLEHWHFEVFNALKNPKDPAFEDQKVQFLTNVKGYVDGLAVSFEPRLKPIVFTMRPDVRLSDPKYSKRFIGEYDLAGRTLGVRLKGNTLVLDTQGQATATLVPDRNDGFTVKEQSETSLRFVSEKDQPPARSRSRRRAACSRPSARPSNSRLGPPIEPDFQRLNMSDIQGSDQS